MDGRHLRTTLGVILCMVLAAGACTDRAAGRGDPGPFEVRLSTGEPVAFTQEQASMEAGDALDDDAVAAIINRLPPFGADNDDRVAFPPTTGAAPTTACRTDRRPASGRRHRFSPPATATAALEVLRRQPEGDVDVAPFISVTFKPARRARRTRQVRTAPVDVKSANERANPPRDGGRNATGHPGQPGYRTRETDTMRFKRGIIAGAAVAWALALTGSAFTATSTIDDSAINVGSVAQTVSGASFTDVVHTYTAAADTTTAISAKAEQLLSTTAGVVTISVNGGAAEDCTITLTDVAPLGTDEGAGDFSSIACDITDTANVTSLRFVVNG